MRSTWGLAVVVVVVVATGCGSGAAPARTDQAAPPDEMLRQMCDSSYEAAAAEFAAAANLARVDSSLGLSGEAQSVDCAGDAWTFEADAGQAARVEMALAFRPVAQPAEPADNYCDTEGVDVNMPFTGFEEREFDGNPYCFSWYRGDRHHAASASYVDRSTEVFLVWSIDSDGDAFDPGTELGELFTAANHAVLTTIYEGFGQA